MKYKYFAYSIILLSIIVFLLIEIYIYTIKEKLIFTNTLIKSRNSGIECLIMGDSHLQGGFKNNLTNCYNLSIGGSSLPMIIDAVESVIENNPLKVVILPLEPHDFSIYRQQNYSPIFKDISKNFNPIYKPLFNTIPVREEVLNYIETKKENDLWVNWSKDERLKRVDKRINMHANLEKFEKSNYANDYKKLIKTLIEKKIKVYLVRTPVTNLYDKKMFEKLNPIKWNNFVKEFTSLGAVFIDFRKINFDNKDDTVFVDEDHLNEKGSKAYVKLIEKVLEINTK